MTTEKHSVNEKEGELLYNLAKKCQGKDCIVEIGSWKGVSTIELAKGSKDGNKCKIYAIDPHTGSPEQRKNNEKIWTFDIFKENIKKAKVDDLIIPIVKTSERAEKKWDKKIELLWIDGRHSYEFVLKDFLIWNKHLMEKGTIAFHDTSYGGPKKVVDKYLYGGHQFKNIKFLSTITFAQKSKKINTIDKIKNRFSFLKKSIYLFIRRIYYIYLFLLNKTKIPK